ncbi:RCBT1 protein, partial [Acromyrmex heyeri]
MIYHFRLCCHDLHIDLITREILSKEQFPYYPEIKFHTCSRYYSIFSIQDFMLVGTDCSGDYCGRYQRSFHLSSRSLNIVKAATGFDHVLVITTEGEIYGWGVNTHGQLNFNRKNLPKTQEIELPTKIFIPNVKHVSDIAAMKYISAFKSSHDGLIYIQGCLNNLKIKRLAICEYTNIFDRYNSSFHSLEENRTLTYEDQYMLYDLEEAILSPSLKSTSDLTIEVNGEFIYVHKFILKIRSLYFKNMFEFNEVENRKRVIKYDDYSYDTYKRFFVFLYTGRFYCVSTNQEFIELLILADKYWITNLEKECIKQLKIRMKPSTVSYIKEMAIQYNKTVAVYYFFFYYFFFKRKIIIYNELDILIQLNFNSLCFFYTFFIPVFVT